MATTTGMSYASFKILLGDGASPEQFTAPCGLNTRSFTETKNVNEIDLPDCEDDDAIAWVGREIRSLDWNISGEGVLAPEAYLQWRAWREARTSRNVMIQFNVPISPPGLETYVGKAIMTTWTVTGNRGEKVTVSTEIVADGALVRVANPAP